MVAESFDVHVVRSVPYYNETHRLIERLSERGFEAMHKFYERTLTWVLDHEYLMLVVTLAVSQAGAGDIRGAFIDRLVLVLSLFHFLEHE